jgi:hypothetical protein
LCKLKNVFDFTNRIIDGNIKNISIEFFICDSFGKKNTLKPIPLNFNLTLQMESHMKILKILIFNISSVILLVKLN